MNLKIIDFLKNERLCVLSVLLEDGAPYGATVHYSLQQEPLKLYMQTSNTTRKAQPFLRGEVSKGAVTIGFSENDWLALQMRGEVRMVSEEEFEKVGELHYRKHPDARVHKRADTIFLEFTPTDWKFTDFNTTPVTIIKD